MPIGLDYHTLAGGDHPAWGKQESPVNQEKDLLTALHGSPPFEARTDKIMGGFSLWTQAARGKILAALNHSQNADLELHTNGSRKGYWEELGKHKFVASPRGNGIDCHRTWEIHLPKLLTHSCGPPAAPKLD